MKKYVAVLLFLGLMLCIPLAFANPYPSSQTFLYDKNWYTTVPCTYAAWQKAYDDLGLSLPMWGNGGDWLINARNSGYATGNEARVNSIAVYNGVTEWGHVSFVTAVSGSTMTLCEGGIPGYGYSTRTQGGWSTEINKEKYPGGDYLIGFIYLDGFKHSFDFPPEGGSESIHLVGWLYNAANVTKSIQIHAYIDGPADPNRRCAVLEANISRKDVDNDFHVGEFHGFDGIISNVNPGNHTLYLYAVDPYLGTNAAIGTVDVEVYPSGASMAVSEQVIPDGSYIIAFAGSKNKGDLTILDIPGSDPSAVDGSNVTIFIASEGDVAPYDIWDVAYHPIDQFYSIKQRGTNMALTVYEPEASNVRANVQVNEYRESDAQLWAISQSSNRMGYQIRSKASGFALEVPYGVDESGRNVHQWLANDSLFETWLFIPYQPSQPIEDGRYIILSTVADGIELDVQGDSGDIPDETPVQLWDDSAMSQFNSFDLVRLTNGYYKIKHAASGKCLEVTRGTSGYGDRVNVYGDNGSIAQQWAIVPNGDGFALIVRSSGYALDSDEGETANSTRVQQYPLHGRSNQTWKFVKAEHTVRYDANGGTNAPEPQTKYYKNALTLSSTIPTRDGLEFKGWQADDVIYAPGAIYTLDQDATMTAVWQSVIIASGSCGAQGNNLTWTLYEDGNLLISGTGAMRDFDYNSTEEWYTYRYQINRITFDAGITRIGEYAFWDFFGVESVTIPDSVTEIGLSAFVGNGFSSVDIPSSVVNIGNGAFFACKNLIEVELPENVTDIGTQVFGACYSLEKVTIPTSVTSIGMSAFMDCKNLKNIELPSSVVSIGQGAFRDCRGLESITIPSSVIRIDDYAFLGCSSLASIQIPPNVIEIGDGAFACCDNLTTITVDPDNEHYSDIDGILFNKSLTEIICCPGATSGPFTISSPNLELIRNLAFNGCKNITQVIIPEGTRSIGDGAFAQCSSLTNVLIPSSVSFFDLRAFSECSSLSSITIPEGIGFIGNYTFYGCESLSSITLPSTVKSVNYNAFSGCEGLKDIYYSGSKDEWKAVSVEEGNEPLSLAAVHYIGTPVLDPARTLTLPAALSFIDSEAFAGVDAQTIVVPMSVGVIAPRAFADCKKLEILVFEGSPNEIAVNAVAGCDKLMYVYAPVDSSAAMWANNLGLIVIYR